MSVQTVSRKSRSWLTTTSVFFQRCKYSSSHSTARRSRWLVGSSKRRSVGAIKRARASEMRMRHPPEKLSVVRFCIAGVKPKPCRIFAARASALSEPFSFRASYTAVSRSDTAAAASSSSSSPAPACPVVPGASSSDSRSSSSLSSSSSARSCIISTSACTTASSALRSSACTSCSTRSTSIESGTGSLRVAISFMMVVLPIPFGPTNPYRRPATMVMEVSLRSSLPRAETEKFSILTSRVPSIAAESGCRASRTVNASSSSRNAASFCASAFSSNARSFCAFFLASRSETCSKSTTFSSRSTSSRSKSSSPLDGSSNSPR
mmetsp:Transcript_25198/g.82700  ORF Transcript_25198/g.82700 Transcript_25198/m.82700 type:complete len:321 (+) Transcript_25198:3162-4124(+)